MANDYAEREAYYGGDLIQTDDGRYGTGGNGPPGRFGPMPTQCIGWGAEINDTTALDKGRRSGMSITRNQTTRPQQRYNERR